MSARLYNQDLQPVPRFSRQWWPETLRTLAWVAVITLLIWVYADLHFTETRDVTVSLRVHVGEGNDVVLVTPADVVLQVRVDGNRHAIERLTARKLSYNAREMGAGTHPVDSVVLLKGLPDVRSAGVEVLSARPPTVEIGLETLRTVSAAVDLDLGDSPVDQVKIEPDHVDVLVPEPVAGRPVRVRTAPINLRDRSAGESVSLDNLELRPPDVPGARLKQQRTVKASFVVGQQAARKTFMVPIRVAQPREWVADNTWATYKLDAKDPLQWTREIAVAGPRIELDKLQPDQIDAYIVLTENDKKVLESWDEKTVRVKLLGDSGANTKLLEVVGPLPKVECRLVKRTAGP